MIVGQNKIKGDVKHEKKSFSSNTKSNPSTNRE